jgi:hypothetical protein
MSWTRTGCEGLRSGPTYALDGAFGAGVQRQGSTEHPDTRYEKAAGRDLPSGSYYS